MLSDSIWIENIKSASLYIIPFRLSRCYNENKESGGRDVPADGPKPDSDSKWYAGIVQVRAADPLTAARLAIGRKTGGLK